MNWEAVGAIGEALGALGVIVSLVYLSVQIRANTRSVKNATYQAVVGSFTEWGDKVLTNREAAEIWMRGSESLAELDPTERVRFSQQAADLFSKFGVALLQHDQGLVRDSTIELWSNSLHEALTTSPGLRAWWSEMGSRIMEPEVRAHVEKLLPREL